MKNARVSSGELFKSLNHDAPNAPVPDDPFMIKKGHAVGKSTDGLQVTHRKYRPGTVFKQTIIGNPPAKSNCYRIISFGGKKKSGFVLDDFYKRQLASCNTIDDVRDLLEDIDDLSTQKHYSLAKSSKLKKYEVDFCLQAMRVRNLAIAQAFAFEMDVWFPTRRSDIDNSLKVVLDCLQPGTDKKRLVNAIINDNLCETVTVRKHIDKSNPRIEFKIIVL